MDKTYLSIDMAEERGFIHRDYIAHCLRWTHVMKRLGESQAWKDARILDIGCGRLIPLATTLYSSRFIVKNYYGVDAGPIDDEAFDRVSKTRKFNIEVFENTDFLQINNEDLDHDPVNWVTCFEMLEHVEPAHMWKILIRLKGLITPDCKLFFSTPCWNVTDCAGNHVNEIKYQVLGSIFEMAGYEVINQYGTFASQSEIRPKLDPDEDKLFHLLRSYYDSNFLSCIFAPLYPQVSRNVLWELRVGLLDECKFPELTDIPEPWGSSTNWDEFKQLIGVV